MQMYQGVGSIGLLAGPAPLKGVDLTKAAYKYFTPSKQYFAEPIAFGARSKTEHIIEKHGRGVINNAIKGAKQKIKMAETPRAKRYAEIQLENLKKVQQDFNNLKESKQA